MALPLFGDEVIVESRSGGKNFAAYSENGVFPNAWNSSTAKSSAPGTTAGIGSRYNSATGVGGVDAWFQVSPTLGVAGGTYKVYVTVSASSAGSAVTSTITQTDCSGLPATTTMFDNTSINTWREVGTITLDPGKTTPTIRFDETANNNRLYADAVRFVLDQPCLTIPVVSVTGPLSTNLNQVVVPGVTNASAVTVYQNSGSGWVQIGIKNSGVTDGNNTVTVSGLVKGAQVGATQTVGGQEGCVPTSGKIVGGGANPRVKISLNIRETSTGGPVGDPGDSSSLNIHFLGASAVSAGAPVNAQVFYPSNGWQTLTFLRGTNEIVGDSANASGAIASAAGYLGNTTVSIQAYAYRTLPNGVTIYSATPATSSDVTSNDVFTVSWTWDAVSGANGYRLLRQVDFTGYNEFKDVAANSLNDDNTGWAAGTTVTPTTSQSGRSVQWNPAASNTNNLPGQWGILEALNFQVDGDTGPFDVYVDNLTSGSTTWQDFEAATVGQQEVSFRRPGFSGFPSGNILGAPDQSIVSGTVADTGTKSLRLQFQWQDTVATRWVRITTSGAGNPMVNLDDPITIRLLMLPVGSSPVPPASPVTITGIGGGQLSYTGGGGSQFVLIKSANVTAPSATWTREATNTTTPGSFSIPVGSEAAAFYRVKSE